MEILLDAWRGHNWLQPRTALVTFAEDICPNPTGWLSWGGKGTSGELPSMMVHPQKLAAALY
jgi:hypothetical protein